MSNELDASRKTAKIIVPDDRHNVVEPIFSKSEFDKAVESKGYDVTIEEAISCPCKVTSTGQGNPLCKNCGGAAWFFISKRKTLAVVQSINKRTKFLNWSETDRGTSQITLKGEDRVSFMDRIVLLEVVSVFSQTTVINVSSDNAMFAFLFYAPTAIKRIFLFTDLEEKHKPLTYAVDYFIEDDHILFTETVRPYLRENSDGIFVGRVGVRYEHNPTYHVIDINRETVKAFSRDDEFEGDYSNLSDDFPIKEVIPVNCVGRKAHYMFDSPNLSGESLYDNTPVEVPSDPSIVYTFRIFFGSTSSIPNNSTAVKALPNSQLTNVGNTVILQTGNINNVFCIALPSPMTLVSVIDEDASDLDLTDFYIQSDISVTDDNGVPRAYKMYVFSPAISYVINHRHIIIIK